MKNFIKLLISLLLIVSSTNCYSQTKDTVDFKVYIQKMTTDTNSNFYYSKLVQKVKNKPSEVSVDDCFFLYYGQIFQKGHNNLSFLANPERLEFDKASMKGNCKKAINLGNIILERNPFDLTVLLHVCNCIKENGEKDNLYLEQRFKNTLSAIFSTGDGKSMKSAIKIANMEDDYVLKGILGFLGGKEKLGFENNHSYSVWEKGTQILYFEDLMNF